MMPITTRIETLISPLAPDHATSHIQKCQPPEPTTSRQTRSSLRLGMCTTDVGSPALEPVTLKSTGPKVHAS